MGIFDYYEFRARIVPAAVIASPLLLPILAFGFSAPSGWLWTTLATTVGLLLIYIFSYFVAYLGRTGENQLWNSWGGAPALTVMTDADKTFPPSTKASIRKALHELYQIDLDACSADSAKWNEQAEEAFRLVRQFLRQHDGKGIWHIHNAEYGALRNLSAGTWIGVALAIVAAGLCAGVWWTDGATLAAGLASIAVILAVVATVCKIRILPRVLRSVAFNYAESAWLCFLNATKTPKSGGKEKEAA